MAILTSDLIAESVRQRLGWAPAELPRIKTMIPAGLQKLVDQQGGTRSSRHYFFTDPATDTVTLDANGVGNLSTLITSKGLLLEKLDSGVIKVGNAGLPLKALGNSSARDLPNPWGEITNVARYSLEGTLIKTISVDDNVTPLSGDQLSFACPRVPGIEDLNIQQRDELISIMILQAQGQPPKAVDSAT